MSLQLNIDLSTSYLFIPLLLGSSATYESLFVIIKKNIYIYIYMYYIFGLIAYIVFNNLLLGILAFIESTKFFVYGFNILAFVVCVYMYMYIIYL